MKLKINGFFVLALFSIQCFQTVSCTRFQESPLDQNGVLTQFRILSRASEIQSTLEGNLFTATLGFRRTNGTSYAETKVRFGIDTTENKSLQEEKKEFLSTSKDLLTPIDGVTDTSGSYTFNFSFRDIYYRIQLIDSSNNILAEVRLRVPISSTTANDLETTVVSGDLTVTPNPTNSSSSTAGTTTGTIADTALAPKMNSFSITSPVVSSLTISDSANTIKGTVNIQDKSNWVATFSYDGSSVTVNGVTQVSGITVNNFNSVVVYRISSANGNTRDYTVTIAGLGIISTTASRVYGQPNFTSKIANRNGIIAADSLNGPIRPFIASNGLYVADQSNARVLFFPGTSSTATRVYGIDASGTNFTSAGNLGVSDRTFNSTPNVSNVVADSAGVYITDIESSRVLYFPNTQTVSTRLYGQSTYSQSASNNGGISATSLSFADGLSVDNNNGLYIADTSNNRVLYYPAFSTTASRVYGQTATGTAFNSNAVGSGSVGLNAPRAVKWTSEGVYITDTGNHRVLFFPGTSVTATRVYGQATFTQTNPNRGTTMSNITLKQPFGVQAFDGKVYIVDYGNNRILEYEGTSTTATRVWGTDGNFINTTNIVGTADNRFDSIFDCDVDGTGMYVADRANNRVLFFPRQ